MNTPTSCLGFSKADELSIATAVAKLAIEAQETEKVERILLWALDNCGSSGAVAWLKTRIMPQLSASNQAWLLELLNAFFEKIEAAIATSEMGGDR